MGTSASYLGPVGVSALLPSWADAGSETDTHPVTPEQAPEASDAVPPADAPTDGDARDDAVAVPWSAPKGMLTRVARGTSASNHARVLGTYVRAAGGARGASRRAAAGQRATAALGGFLGAVSARGIADAVRALGIGDFVGRSAQALLADLVDLLAPSGALLEEAAARKALISTMDDLFREFDVEANGLEALNAMDRAAVERVTLQSVVNYIHERWQQQLVICIERGTIRERDANTLIAEVKSFIVATVTFDFRDVDVIRLDWRSGHARSLVERVYRSAYALLETP
jgi:hypothetical protein